jgi:hypothetical protein
VEPGGRVLPLGESGAAAASEGSGAGLRHAPRYYDTSRAPGIGVGSQYRGPGEPRSRVADAIIVAPATYNTINKWAQGISDTYALGVLAETTALGVPIVVLPFVNSALASPALRSAAASRTCAAKASASCLVPVA